MNASITSKQKSHLLEVGASFGRSAGRDVAGLILKQVEVKDFQSFLGRTNRIKRAMLAAGLDEAKKIANAPELLKPIPFIPAAFCGTGWEFDPNEPQDANSLALKRLDPLNVAFESFLEERESVITGEERLARAKTQNRVRLDARWFMALLKEEGYKTLEWFFATYGVEWIEFLGSPLRTPRGRRFSLVLSRDDDCTWDWHYDWLDIDRLASDHAAVLAS